MKLSVSNIAWPAELDDEVAARLRALGVEGVEIAPTKAWPQPIAASRAEREAYRRRWQARGLPIVAAQALLFGHDELRLFADEETRRRCQDYLVAMIELGADLGCEALVFGSPRNRQRGALAAESSWAIALDFFGALALAAERAGTVLVLEANPTEYGADFITSATEALALVRELDRPGLRLHLDTACMTLAGDPIEETIAEAGALLRHFHISEPMLGPIGTGQVAHARFATALRRVGYPHWISVEMRAGQPFGLEALAQAVAVARAGYDQAAGATAAAAAATPTEQR